MKVLLVHPGTQHSYKLAIQLEKMGYLYKFCTGFSLTKNSLLVKCLPNSIFNKIQNRIIDIPSEKLHTNFVQEFYMKYNKRIDKPPHEIQYLKNEYFQNSIPEYLFKNCDVIIGFDTASNILVKKARKYNKLFILDRTIGHPASQSNMFKLLNNLYPKWEVNSFVKEKQHIDYEQFEHAEATKIVAPSKFVKKTLVENGVATSKIIINPFGTNLDYFSKIKRTNACNKKDINFLFFGSVSSRKGSPALLEAWAKLKPNKATLTFAGYGSFPEGTSLPDNVKFLGPIAANMRDTLFANADVFVFPSFFEGFAQVQIEAAASGLPLITTSNAGGDEIVENYKNGILINPENINELVDAIQYFIDNPNRINEMGNISKKIALDKFSWSHYGNRWKKILINLDKK